MPALPPHPQTLRIDHLFTIGEDLNARVRWHMTYTGTAPTNATCSTLAADIEAAWVTALIGFLSTQDAITGVEVTDLTSPTSGAGQNIATTPGTRAGPFLPAEVAVLVNMPISRRYRGGKPRSYWRFFVAGDLSDEQTWLPLSVSNLHGALEGYLGALEALTVAGTSLSTLVSVSDYQGFTAVQNPITGRWRNVPKVRAAAIPNDVILALNVRTRPASQRRRALLRS